MTASVIWSLTVKLAMTWALALSPAALPRLRMGMAMTAGVMSSVVSAWIRAPLLPVMMALTGQEPLTTLPISMPSAARTAGVSRPLALTWVLTGRAAAGLAFWKSWVQSNAKRWSASM